MACHVSTCLEHLKTIYISIQLSSRGVPVQFVEGSKKKREEGKREREEGKREMEERREKERRKEKKK